MTLKLISVRFGIIKKWRETWSYVYNSAVPCDIVKAILLGKINAKLHYNDDTIAQKSYIVMLRFTTLLWITFHSKQDFNTCGKEKSAPEDIRKVLAINASAPGFKIINLKGHTSKNFKIINYKLGLYYEKMGYNTLKAEGFALSSRERKLFSLSYGITSSTFKPLKSSMGRYIGRHHTLW